MSRTSWSAVVVAIVLLTGRPGDGVADSLRRVGTTGSALGDAVEACRHGQAESCAAIAAALRARSDDPKLLERAAFLELRACALGMARACAAIRGDVASPDPSRTIARRATRACDEGDATSCAALGHHYLHGDGVARDPRRAYRAFRRACDLNQAYGCVSLARAFRVGQVVERDLARATALERRACSLDPGACTQAPRTARR